MPRIQSPQCKLKKKNNNNNYKQVLIYSSIKPFIISINILFL